MDDFLIKTGEQANEEVAVSYLLFGIKNQETNKLTVFTKNERKVVPKSIVLVFSQETFKQLTGKELNLSSNQIALYTKNKTLKTQKSLSIDGKNYQIHRQLGDFINKKIPNIYKIIVSDYSYLVVPDIKIFESSMKGTSITQATYVGVNVKNPTHDAKKNLDLLDQIAGEATKQLDSQTTGVPVSYFSANSRYDAEGMVNGFVGGTLLVSSYPSSSCLAQFL